MLKWISPFLFLLLLGCGRKVGIGPNSSGGPTEFKKTFPDFLKRMEENKVPGAYYAMRVWVEKDGIRENVWVRYAMQNKDGQWEAMFAGDPKLLKGVDHSDSTKFDIKDVNDWMIINPDNSVEGSFSSQVTPITHKP